MTKYGAVKTDHILFIAAGAFHVNKPSDLIPELQGRFPILGSNCRLSHQRGDLKRTPGLSPIILCSQYSSLFWPQKRWRRSISALKPLIILCGGSRSGQCERTADNRCPAACTPSWRKVLEELLFHAPYMQGHQIVIDQAFVRQRLDKMAG